LLERRRLGARLTADLGDAESRWGVVRSERTVAVGIGVKERALAGVVSTAGR
jgi:hypothetical protein